MIGLGRRNAYSRTAHLFCELLTRYEAVGLTRDDSFELAISQADLGDALGLSIVHVNRVLQRLRGERLIEMKNRRVTVLDRDRLETAAEFDPTYLYPTMAASVAPRRAFRRAGDQTHAMRV